MADDASLQDDVEPAVISSSSPEFAPKGPVGRKSLSNIRRELTDKELAAPAVQRMLVGEIDRLDEERESLLPFRERYYSHCEKVAVLEEKFKTKISIEIIHVGLLTVGSAALGLAPNVWSTQPLAALIVAFGVILVGAAIWAKGVKL
jgi:hypothetical protein